MLFSCHSKKEKIDPDIWYSQTKDFILTESNLPTDSTATEYFADGNQQKVKLFNNGHPTVEKWYQVTGEQIAETKYSRDGQFELRKEICQNGQIAFEGIFYKTNPYGLSTWFGCTKIKQKEGIRFKDKKVGIWKSWNDKGEVTETDYKNIELIDSLQIIKNFDNGID